MIQKKKGVSPVIASVLLIVITLAIIGILWKTVLPLVTGGLETSQACMDVGVSINEESGYTCIDTTTKKVSVHIERGESEGDLEDINIIVGGCGTSTAERVKDDLSLEVPGSLESKTYEVDAITDTGGAACDPQEVGVAAVVKIGKTEKRCAEVSRTTLLECA